MKKYKLLQEYPLLPNSMKVGFEVEWNNPLNAYHHALTLDVFNKSEVEKYPKFWKAIEIYDFQITSLRGVKEFCLEGTVYTIGSDGTFRSDGHPINLSGISLHSMLHEGNSVDSGYFEIFSIVRLSDGEVFTLGDKVHFGENGIIEQFNLQFNKITVNIKYILGIGNGYDNASLNTIKKLKIPLLITEDGVDMYEGDTIHVPQVDYTGEVTKQILSYKVTNDIGVNSKIFSTKAAAERYILMNKKCISISNLYTLGLLTPFNKISKLDPILISFVKKQVGQK